MKHFWRSKRY